MNRRYLALFAFAAFAIGVALCPLWRGASASATGRRAEPEPQRRARQTRGRRTQQRAARPRVDYSNFSHSTAAHRARSCQSCHTIPTPNWSRVRDQEQAYPDVTDYPEHASCLDCHRRQFFSGARPVICSVCHSTVSPRSDARFAFPNPAELWAKSPKKNKGESEFVTRFPHDKHQDVMARLNSDELTGGFGFVRASFLPQEREAEKVNSCTVCHKLYEPKGKSEQSYIKPPEKEPEKDRLGREEPFWFKKGAMMTTPTSHASCFNCHWKDGGEAPLSTKCDGCHTLVTAGMRLQLNVEGADAAPDHPSVVGAVDGEVVEQWKQRRVARFVHEISRHQSRTCISCHVAITGATTINSDTLSVPIQTCGTSQCHGATGERLPAVISREVRAKRADASFQCIKCHLNLSDAPADEIPRSHLRMVQ
jgi:hypothetical protein